MADGHPHSSVVWFDYEGEYLRINTARGRQKEKNFSRDRRVSVTFVDPQDPFRWMEIRGIVGEPIEAGAVDHIHKLSMKYTGKRYYGDFAPAERQFQETRIMYTIKPTKVLVSH
jgi:PPOX class probable F420-dependent enzyme